MAKRLNKFGMGLVTGGVLAAAGVGWLMSDDKTRRRAVKGGKRAMRKAGDFLDDMRDMV